MIPKRLCQSPSVQHLYWYGQQVRPPVTGPLTSRRHYASSRSNCYDTLEVTPNATQAQIKAAYYRLSKKYHPDVSKDDGAKHKFAMISEAYEILGSQKNRALYDRGMLNPNRINVSHQASSEEDIDEEYADFLKKRSSFKRKMDIPTGRTSTFNYDEFYRQHYSESLKQSYQDKQDYAKYEEELKNAQIAQRTNSFVYLSILISLAVLFSLLK